MGRKRTAKLAPVLEDNGTDADTYASAMSGKIVPEAVQRIVDELEAQGMPADQHPRYQDDHRPMTPTPTHPPTSDGACAGHPQQSRR